MSHIFFPAKTRKEAIAAKGFDWAKVVKVCGGYMFFETVSDYEIWKNQK